MIIHMWLQLELHFLPIYWYFLCFLLCRHVFSQDKAYVMLCKKLKLKTNEQKNQHRKSFQCFPWGLGEKVLSSNTEYLEVKAELCCLVH